MLLKAKVDELLVEDGLCFKVGRQKWTLCSSLPSLFGNEEHEGNTLDRLVLTKGRSRTCLRANSWSHPSLKAKDTGKQDTKH